jgi:hypothetical protein
MDPSKLLTKCKGGKENPLLPSPAFLACLALLEDLRAL